MDGVIIARRATLMSHLKNIFITPFIFLLAVICLKIWMLPFLFLSLGVLGVKGDGVAISGPNFLQVVIFGGIVVFFWIVASFLSVVDHFRYAGWMTVGEKPYAPVLTSFTKTFLQADWDGLEKLCTDEFRLRTDLKAFRNHCRRCESQLGHSRTELKLDVRGFFRLPILEKAIPVLADYRDDRTDAVALVLYNNPAGQIDRNQVPTLRLRMKRDGSEIRIDAFDVVQVALNQ